MWSESIVSTISKPAENRVVSLSHLDNVRSDSSALLRHSSLSHTTAAARNP
jgi:hypothetical protein